MGLKRTFTKIQKGEIRRKLAKVKKKKRDIKAYNRLQALRMYSQGMPNAVIAEALEYSVYYITELVSKYISKGIEAIVEDKRTSNNRRLSYEEETEFLEQFVEIAEAGQVLTAHIIKEKFEEKTGEEAHINTIYCLLKRHGWRKVRPRPTNPGKASEEEIASCKKKLTGLGNSGYWTNTSKTAEQVMRK